jgi:hypothetical protein
LIPEPVDLPRFGAARVWREMSDALERLRTRNAVMLERIQPATETVLIRVLAECSAHVLHFVGHAQSRTAARYGTIALESSEGRARKITADYLAGAIAQCRSVRVVVLQPSEDTGGCFAAITDALLEHGIKAIVCTGALRGTDQHLFIGKLYAGLVAGLSANALSKELNAALVSEVGMLTVHSRSPEMALFPVSAEPHATAAPAMSAIPEAVVKAPAPAWHDEIKRKRAASEFDVFLCHNTADKPAVKRIATRLKEAGLLPWLDIWELPPGQPWQPLLEQQIGNIKAAAVFVGSAALGPWQEQEIYSFLREFAARKVPVIPVLLEDAPSRPDLPMFLRAMTWVDFRTRDPDPFGSLVWGITGKRPED